MPVATINEMPYTADDSSRLEWAMDVLGIESFDGLTPNG
jgi:hypothetical protein